MSLSGGTLKIGILVAMAIPPLIFPISQAGYISMNLLVYRALLPSLILFFLLLFQSRIQKQDELSNRINSGIKAGLLATFGLESVRIISFNLGDMPGNLPELMGVLLTNQIMGGPTFLSDLAGWGYHFYNGICFGVIYTLLFPKSRTVTGILYGWIIGVVFLLSPVTSSQGIGFMGHETPSMPITVLFAHTVFGAILGFLAQQWSPGGQPLLWKNVQKENVRNNNPGKIGGNP